MSDPVRQLPRACIFCGGPKPTREHVLPVWITAVLPGKGSFFFEQQGKRWSSKDAGKTVKGVCASCNNGWMSQLENEAKPLLTPAIRGEPLALSVADQRIVATWAAKTALMSELGRLVAPAEFVSRQEHQHLFLHRVPAPGTYVWMAGCRGTKSVWIEQHQLELQSSTERDTGRATTMSIGHLVLQVMQVPDHIKVLSRLKLPRLWPDPDTKAPLRPHDRLSDEDLRRLSRTMLTD